MICVEGTEKFPDEVGAPGADGFGPRASPLLQAIIDGFEQRELALNFAILIEAVSVRDACAGELGEARQFIFRRVASNVLENVGDRRRRIFCSAQLWQLAKQKGGSRGVRDAKRNIGNGLLIVLAKVFFEQGLENAFNAKLIAERSANNVNQVSVVGRRTV